jgi:hypothetical protein
MRLLIALLILIVVSSVSAHAQWYIGVKLMGISIHTDQMDNKHLFLNTIGKNKRVAFHLGGALTVEYRVNNWLAFKCDQVLFRDCAGKTAGMTMLNVRYVHDFSPKDNASIGAGPFWYYRKSWKQFDAYKDDGYFKDSPDGKWQRKFVWYGGEIEYNRKLNNNLDWSTNVLPGIPVVIAVASGVRTGL